MSFNYIDEALDRASRPTRLITATRQWSSGRVKFSVIGWKDKPDRNYIILEKNLFGRTTNQDQKFNLRQNDWQNLKKLIDEDFQNTTGWNQGSDTIHESLDAFLLNDPDAISKVLASKNIAKLSDASMESLDGFLYKVYDVKRGHVDLIIQRLCEAGTDEVDVFGSLLEDLKLSQVSMMASLVYQKLKVLSLLEGLVMSTVSKEKDVHKIFESNPWLLGSNYEILKSEKTLSDYLDVEVKEDPETAKRPDIIAKIVPYVNDIVLVEFKSPQIKLKAKHIGQVLEYEEIIRRYRPNTRTVHKFLFGYEKDNNFVMSNDVQIKTFSEIISEKRQEFQEYQKVLESDKEIAINPIEIYE